MGWPFAMGYNPTYFFTRRRGWLMKGPMGLTPHSGRTVCLLDYHLVKHTPASTPLPAPVADSNQTECERRTHHETSVFEMRRLTILGRG
jgi:hypothetical protein